MNANFLPDLLWRWEKHSSAFQDTRCSCVLGWNHSHTEQYCVSIPSIFSLGEIVQLFRDGSLFNWLHVFLSFRFLSVCPSESSRFFYLFIYWSIVGLQCCVSFLWWSKVILTLFSDSFPLRFITRCWLHFPRLYSKFCCFYIVRIVVCVC